VINEVHITPEGLEGVRRELDEWRHRGMAKAGVSFPAHPGELMIGNIASHEGPDDLGGDRGVGLPGQSGEGLRRKLRPGLGKVESAIPGKPGEENFGEAELRRLAAGTHIFHGS